MKRTMRPKRTSGNVILNMVTVGKLEPPLRVGRLVQRR